MKTPWKWRVPRTRSGKRYILKRNRGPFVDDEIPSAKENNIVINPVNEEISDPTQEEHPLDMTYIAEPPIFKNGEKYQECRCVSGSF